MKWQGFLEQYRYVSVISLGDPVKTAARIGLLIKTLSTLGLTPVMRAGVLPAPDHEKLNPFDEF